MIRKLAVFMTLIFFSLPVCAQKMTANDVVAKHLDSIGTAETRAGVQNVVLVGEVTQKYIAPKDLDLSGRAVLASAGPKNFFGISLSSRGSEQYIFDGKKAKINLVQSGQRSVLANFLQSNDLLIEDGLLSGTLSSSWALANLAGSKSKLSFNGIRKINEKEAYAIGYSRKGGDLTITLFFDKETFRHIRTEYSRIFAAAIGVAPEDASKLSETRIKMTEDFSDFREEKGLTLPHSYRILYSATGQRGTSEVEWAFTFATFAFNQKLDDQTFNTN
ncbi:MAG TPA: hypothetical protein VGO50_09530 [Pyrinomonadaceae bacterium]|jgi:hypothetical protein|nr:hypothetical protein [Pyrinomonadaceae bacterium]